MQYERTRLESWAACYLLCRTLGTTPSRYLGFVECADSCPLDASRWKLVKGKFGSYFECRDCCRFIGYERKEPCKK